MIKKCMILKISEQNISIVSAANQSTNEK